MKPSSPSANAALTGPCGRGTVAVLYVEYGLGWGRELRVDPFPTDATREEIYTRHKYSEVARLRRAVIADAPIGSQALLGDEIGGSATGFDRPRLGARQVVLERSGEREKVLQFLVIEACRAGLEKVCRGAERASLV